MQMLENMYLWCVQHHDTSHNTSSHHHITYHDSHTSHTSHTTTHSTHHTSNVHWQLTLWLLCVGVDAVSAPLPDVAVVVVEDVVEEEEDDDDDDSVIPPLLLCSLSSRFLSCSLFSSALSRFTSFSSRLFCDCVVPSNTFISCNPWLTSDMNK